MLFLWTRPGLELERKYRIDYYHHMNTETPSQLLSRVLHWFVIIMLMITPMRAVVAGQSHCDMAMNGVSQAMSDNMRLVHKASRSSINKSSTVMIAVISPEASETAIPDSQMTEHKCCLETGYSHCNNHCDMSMHFTMMLQPTVFDSSIVLVSQIELMSEQPVFRQQSPLLHPPTQL